MKVLSCNIRYYGGDDGPNAWDERRDLCIQVIAMRRPDLVCLQECWEEQLGDLAAKARCEPRPPPRLEQDKVTRARLRDDLHHLREPHTRRSDLLLGLGFATITAAEARDAYREQSTCRKYPKKRRKHGC